MFICYLKTVYKFKLKFNNKFWKIKIVLSNNNLK